MHRVWQREQHTCAKGQTSVNSASCIAAIHYKAAEHNAVYTHMCDSKFLESSIEIQGCIITVIAELADGRLWHHGCDACTHKHFLPEQANTLCTTQCMWRSANIQQGQAGRESYWQSVNFSVILKLCRYEHDVISSNWKPQRSQDHPQPKSARTVLAITALREAQRLVRLLALIRRVHVPATPVGSGRCRRGATVLYDRRLAADWLPLPGSWKLPFARHSLTIPSSSTSAGLSSYEVVVTLTVPKEQPVLGCTELCFSSALSQGNLRLAELMVGSGASSS